MSRSPHNLVLRLLLASLAAVAVASVSAPAFVRVLLPVFRREIALLDADFSLLSLEESREGARVTIRLRANLSHPLEVEGRLIEPFGVLPDTPGWFQSDLGLFGAVQSALVLLIGALGWPASRPAELALRGALCVPLAIALTLIDAPLDLLGTLQHGVIAALEPGAFLPLFMWGRFLEGGGALVLGLAAAACVVALAAVRGGVRDATGAPDTQSRAALAGGARR